MIAEIARVPAGTIDERGFASAEELQAHHIHAGRRDHPAVVADVSLVIEDGHVQPRIVEAVPGRPDDCFDLPACEI